MESVQEIMSLVARSPRPGCPEIDVLEAPRAQAACAGV